MKSTHLHTTRIRRGGQKMTLLPHLRPTPADLNPSSLLTYGLTCNPMACLLIPEYLKPTLGDAIRQLCQPNLTRRHAAAHQKHATAQYTQGATP